MSSIVLTGDTSGQVTLAAPAIAGSNTATLQAATGTLAFLSDGLGYSQTWQAVTRAFSTTYTNNTGKPIVWRYSITSSGSGQLVSTISVGAITYVDQWQVTAGYIVGNNVIVPAGATYSFAVGGAAGGTAGQSYELR